MKRAKEIQPLLRRMSSPIRLTSKRLLSAASGVGVGQSLTPGFRR